MNIKHRKLLNALLGFAAGIVTLPLAIFAWPIFTALFFWNETDEDEGDNGDSGDSEDGGDTK